jgi:hypothetical protein
MVLGAGGMFNRESAGRARAPSGITPMEGILSATTLCSSCSPCSWPRSLERDTTSDVDALLLER